MPYVSRHVEKVEDIQDYWPEFASLVKEALAQGKRVEIQSTNFLDPGDDWNGLLIEDEAVPGSRKYGY